MTKVVIAGATRTPIGTLNGALSSMPAHVVGADEVDEVIFGQVLTGGAGQNPARQAAVAAGVPVERTALTVNQVCGSGAAKASGHFGHRWRHGYRHVRAAIVAASEVMTDE